MVAEGKTINKMDVNNNAFFYPLSDGNAAGIGVPLYSWGMVDSDEKVQDGDIALVELDGTSLVVYVDFMPNRTMCIRYKDDKRGHGLIAKEGDPLNIVGKVVGFCRGVRISY